MIVRRGRTGPVQRRAGGARVEGRGPFRGLRPPAPAASGIGPADGRTTFVTGDKHGGRHYYIEPLSQAFPDAWIDRGPEGPDLSRYTIRERRPAARTDA